MSRGKKWEPWMDQVLNERYADESNAELCRILGVALRTVERHASALGLKKSEEHWRRHQQEASKGAKRWFEWMKLTGQKIKRRPGGKRFEKGHRWDAETEEKRVNAIRDRAWDERRRLMHGWQRKTRWRMVDDFKKKI